MAPRRSGACWMCGTYRERLQRDHIVPKFEGGSNEIDNIQYLCANCHQDKTLVDIGRYKQTDEQISRRIAALTGLKKIEQHKRRIGDALRASYANNGHPWQGKTHGPGARAKLSASKMGEKNPNYGKKPWNWKGSAP